MSFPRHKEYQDSGLNWLGQVPTHWSLRRLGYFFGERREKVSDRDYQALSVTKDGIVPQLDTAAKTDDGDNRKKVCQGDFVINSRSDRKGSAGLSELDGSVSLISTVLKPKESVHGPFVHHLLRSIPFQEEFYRFGKGIVADLWSTNYSSMSGITLAMPPLSEQASIASFLDRETANIDALIAEQERLIELLQEKRQAVISHAVTKGLNPNVPMKDSGVEWLGEVPEHWVIRDLAKTTLLLQTGPFGSQLGTADYENEGVAVINPSSITGSSINTIRGPFISTSKALELNRHKLYKGDLIIARRGEMGRCAVVEDEKEERICGTGSILVRPIVSMCTDFMAHIIRSEYSRASLSLNSVGSTMENLSAAIVGKLRIPVPPKDEQVQIVNRIQDTASSHQNLTDNAARAIELLQERRAALISAAVTGQIDVRGLVAEEEPA